MLHGGGQGVQRRGCPAGSLQSLELISRHAGLGHARPSPDIGEQNRKRGALSLRGVIRLATWVPSPISRESQPLNIWYLRRKGGHRAPFL